MRSIAVLNQKGGVGKTTTAVNLSAALAAGGSKVCLIDLDPQAHATLHLGHTPGESGNSVYEVLLGNSTFRDALRNAGENLWLLESHIDLAAAEVELAGVVGREAILRDKIAEGLGREREGDRQLMAERQGAEFDFLLIDCPPSLGILSLNALAAVDEVLLPLQPHFLALHGLSKLLQTIEMVSRRVNPRLTLRGVVLCQYESATRLAGEVSQNVVEYFESQRDKPSPWSGSRVFQSRIRRNIRLAEAPSFGQSIFDYAPDSHGAEDYRSLAQEIVQVGAAGAWAKSA
ncbi:MAG TPA: ParA family protein [Pirellulales bacterium]|jgi:chromosome partitioning protein